MTHMLGFHAAIWDLMCVCVCVCDMREELFDYNQIKTFNSFGR
jgi:hypothetical protein